MNQCHISIAFRCKRKRLPSAHGNGFDGIASLFFKEWNQNTEQTGVSGACRGGKDDVFLSWLCCLLNDVTQVPAERLAGRYTLSSRPQASTLTSLLVATVATMSLRRQPREYVHRVLGRIETRAHLGGAAGWVR